jgi:ribosomal-protein-alanine N-acetyltransferase
MDLINFEKQFLDDILEIEKESFPHPWTSEMFLSSAKNNAVTFKVLTEKKNVVGYYIISTVSDETEVIEIAVGTQFRRKNFGKFMFADILKEAILKKSKFIFLEVRKSNTPALNLYKSFGFKEIVIRKNYYKIEDAILLKLLV